MDLPSGDAHCLPAAYCTTSGAYGIAASLPAVVPTGAEQQQLLEVLPLMASRRKRRQQE
jgi:hypothetical protein